MTNIILNLVVDRLFKTLTYLIFINRELYLVRVRKIK